MSSKKYVPVSQVMRSPAIEVDGSISVLEAMKVMKRESTTTLVVKRRHERDEIGLLLFSDIASKVIASDRAPERVNVYEVMTKPVVCVRAEMNIRHCASLFQNLKINHAPVIEDDEVKGVVSTYMIVLAGLPELEED